MAFRITGGNTNARQPLERITVALWVHCQVPDVAPVAAGFAPAQRHSLQREGPPSPAAGQGTAEKGPAPWIKPRAAAASSPFLVSPHLIQGATPIGQLPSAGCCLRGLCTIVPGRLLWWSAQH